MCDCVFPWCLRANSPLSGDKLEGLRWEGRALFNACAAILYYDFDVIRKFVNRSKRLDMDGYVEEGSLSFL